MPAKKNAINVKNKQVIEPRAIISGVNCWCRFDEEMDITALIENPRNPNKHPDKQIALLAKIIRNQGWRQPITVSKRTGFIVKGHGRLAAAKVLNVELVPVEYQDYETEAAEYADLMADNRISEIAETDAEMIADLLKDVMFEDFDLELTGFDAEFFAKDFSEIEISKDFEEEKEKKEPELLSKYDGEKINVGPLKGTSITNTIDVRNKSNMFEFADLLHEKCVGVETDIGIWCGKDYSDNHSQYLYNVGTDSVRGLDFSRTVLSFYTEDERWESLVWGTKWGEFICKTINAGIKTLVTPDFSTYWEWPQAARIFNIHRSRWISRTWQEFGLNIIPSLQFSPMDSEYYLVGIPESIPCLAVQWHAAGKTKNEKDFVEQKKKGILQACLKIKPKQLLIYSNEKGLSFINEINNIEFNKIEKIHVLTRMQHRHEKINERR